MSFVKKAVHAVVHAIEHPIDTIKKVVKGVVNGVKKVGKEVFKIGKSIVMGVVHDVKNVGKGMLKCINTLGHTIGKVGSDVIHGHIGQAFQDGGKGIVDVAKAGGTEIVNVGKLALDCPITPGLGQLGMVKNGAVAVADTVKTVAGTSKAATYGAKAAKTTITTGATIGGSVGGSEALNKIVPSKPEASADKAAPDKPATSEKYPVDELPAYDKVGASPPGYDPHDNPFLSGDMTPGNAPQGKYSYNPLENPGGYTPESPEFTSNLTLPGSDKLPLAAPWAPRAPVTPAKTFTDTPYTSTTQQPIDFNPLVR